MSRLVQILKDFGKYELGLDYILRVKDTELKFNERRNEDLAWLKKNFYDMANSVTLAVHHTFTLSQLIYLIYQIPKKTERDDYLSIVYEATLVLGIFEFSKYMFHRFADSRYKFKNPNENKQNTLF